MAMNHAAVIRREIASQVLPLLGWSGQVVKARAWSASRLVVCTLDQEEHERRAAAGIPPVTDPLALRCVGAGDPRFLARSPVKIAGAVAVRSRWRSATLNLGGFTAFGSVAAVLPPGQAGRLDVAVEASVEGYGVVAWDGHGEAQLVHHPADPPAIARTWVHRLVEEIVYNQVLLARARQARGGRGAWGCPG